MKKQLLVIWIILVFILLVVPMPPAAGAVVDGITNADKFVHFFMFGIFSFLVIYSYRDRYKNDALFLMSILLGAIYASLGEFVQSFLLSRTSSMNDFYAGVAGSLFFVIIYYVKVKKT